MSEPLTLNFGGERFECDSEESVLEALTRQGAKIPYSCRNGTCLTCVMRARHGEIPKAAQAGLKSTLAMSGHLLACMCRPQSDLDLCLPDDAALYNRSTVVHLDNPVPSIRRVFLRPATPLYYRAGQFLNLRREDGLLRSYSLASVPRHDENLELHIKRLDGGAMSNWIFEKLEIGEQFDIQGPNGNCFYVPGQAQQKLLLIGTGSGLAPLIGIARDALYSNHRGEIRLYHGSRTQAGLYLNTSLAELAHKHENFQYHPCISGADLADGYRAGRAEAVAFEDVPNLSGWRIFLCGYPPMVKQAQKMAYLMGAGLDDIHVDPFELQDLRHKVRD